MQKMITPVLIQARPEVEVEIPLGGRIIDVSMPGTGGQKAHLWVLHDIDAAREKVKFTVIGQRRTFTPAPDSTGDYVGSFEMDTVRYFVFQVRPTAPDVMVVSREPEEPEEDEPEEGDEDDDESTTAAEPARPKRKYRRRRSGRRRRAAQSKAPIEAEGSSVKPVSAANWDLED